MPHSISLPRLLFLVGGTVVALAVVLLVFWAVLRLLRKQASGQTSSAALPLRIRDEQAFMSGAVQGVIVNLKAKEKQLTESLRSAEQRAEQLARILDSLGTILPYAFCVINREGLIVLWNQQFRSLLRADVWSRRHFEEVFRPAAALTALLRDCLESGQTCQEKRIECGAPEGESKTLLASAVPWRSRTGDVAGVVCLLKEPEGSVN
jgi:PAS domain-containing protein